MRILMIGCEYVGKTTLGEELCKWMEENMGRGQFGGYGWHHHFVLPYDEGTGPEADERAEGMLAINPPTLLQSYSIYMTDYHFQMLGDDHLLITNWYFGDAVYAPLYYGFGGPGLKGHDTRLLARHSDAKLKKAAPDMVLVLLKASPEAVRQRKRENPHPRCILQDEHVELVLERFEEEYNNSVIRRRFTLDTTEATVEESFQEFLQCMEPHFSTADRLAMLNHERLTRA